MSINDYLLKLFRMRSPLEEIGMATSKYNCFAYAVGLNTLNIYPLEFPPLGFNEENEKVFWPTDIPNDDSLDNFLKMFQMFGYELCETSSKLSER